MSFRRRHRPESDPELTEDSSDSEKTLDSSDDERKNDKEEEEEEDKNDKRVRRRSPSHSPNSEEKEDDGPLGKIVYYYENITSSNTVVDSAVLKFGRIVTLRPKEGFVLRMFQLEYVSHDPELAVPGREMYATWKHVAFLTDTGEKDHRDPSQRAWYGARTQLAWWDNQPKPVTIPPGYDPEKFDLGLPEGTDRSQRITLESGSPRQQEKPLPPPPRQRKHPLPPWVPKKGDILYFYANPQGLRFIEVAAVNDEKRYFSVIHKTTRQSVQPNGKGIVGLPGDLGISRQKHLKIFFDGRSELPFTSPLRKWEGLPLPLYARPS